MNLVRFAVFSLVYMAVVVWIFRSEKEAIDQLTGVVFFGTIYLGWLMSTLTFTVKE